MARSKLKKKKKQNAISLDETEVEEDNKVPIPSLPNKFLWMKVNSGTKIRNVLDYSLKEFRNHKCVVWSGTGQAIGKVISCAEIFKRKHTGLHQITKLRYIRSKISGKEEVVKENRRVPDMHILLSKDALDVKEPGYQAPGACAMFQDSRVTSSTDKSNEQQEVQGGKTRMSDITAEEFAAMGLRTGQKRPRRESQADIPKKKNRKRGENKANSKE